MTSLLTSIRVEAEKEVKKQALKIVEILKKDDSFAKELEKDFQIFFFLEMCFIQRFKN